MPQLARWSVGVLLVGLSLGAISCGGGGGGGGGKSAATTAGVTPAPSTSSSVSVPASSTSPAVPPARSRNAVVVARHGEGFLELHHGDRKVLHTKGTSYERGVQYGFLVGDEVEGILGKLPVYAARMGGNLAAYAQALITPAGSMIMRPYFDRDALEEIRGILDGMRLRNPGTFVREQDLVFMNSLIDIGAVVDLQTLKCSGLAVWGDISKDRKLFQTRVVDLMVGSGIEAHALVVMAKPTGGVPYVNLGWAGMIGCASGLNARGIGISQVWAFSVDKGFGRPWILSMRELMSTGTSVDDAVRILSTDRRTYGSNFVFADRGDTRGGQPRGIAIEVSQRDFAQFESNDPKEDLALWNGQPYAIKIPFAVFRGDAAMDPILRSRQTASNGPTGDPRAAGAYQNRYEGQGRRIQAYVNAGQKIGADECIEITKAVAMRRSSLQCCVYANTDLEVWVANARTDAAGQSYDAWTEPYRHYSLDDYAPVARAVPDRSTARLGESLHVAVPLETLGRGHGLDVRVSLDLGGSMTLVGRTTGVVLPDRGNATAIVQVTIPSTLSNVGVGKLTAEVVEVGTTHVVDVATVPFTVTP